MKRRRRIALIMMLALVLAVPQAFARVGDEDFGYEKVRIKKFPISLQCWTFRKFTFMETLDKAVELGIENLQPYPGQALSPDRPGEVFDHNLDAERIAWIRGRLEDKGLSLVSYGVVNFDNQEAEMRKVFDFARRLGIGTIVTEPDYDDFSLIEKMVKEYDIRIALHNHPLPTKYARPETVLDHVAGLDDRIGACADTAHWMRSGIDPLAALRLLKGRVIDVHLKDLNEFGRKDAFDVPLGQGKAGIHDILAELTVQDFGGFLAIEHEKPGDASNPGPPVREGLKFIRSVTDYQDYEQVLTRRNWRYYKHGWNHYGPGYFKLDEKTGVLEGVGGMGLFWYSIEKLRDFELDLEYRCADEFTNSGVFLRVPQLPTSDDYIFHSFEIQINDGGEGIHKTGAVYDAQAPAEDAINKAGQWNHMRITFSGKRIQVEINGRLILDWEAEPRGKVRDFASEGYIGLQNHDSRSPVYFRNIFIKKL